MAYDPNESRSVPRDPFHRSYEKGGLILQNSQIPWNAEAVQIETLLNLPANARNRSDYRLEFPGFEPIVAESLTAQPNGNFHRLNFRIPFCPPRSLVGQMCWGEMTLAPVSLDILTEAECARGVSLALPTIYVQLGNRVVAAQTVVASQLRQLSVAAVLRSSFVQLAALGESSLAVELVNQVGEVAERVPVTLSASQRRTREALIHAIFRRKPSGTGDWQVRWVLGERILDSLRLQTVTRTTFERSLRVSDTRFVLCNGDDVRLEREVQNRTAQRIGPCFVVSSELAGVAGFATLRVQAQVHGTHQPPVMDSSELLITDGRTVFAPGTCDAADFAQILAFELVLGRRVVGTLPVSPFREARFNSEGGFTAPPNFRWNATAQSALDERLNRLLDN
ncbi:hypothetical protein [Tuwongella immobilis]|uniref:Uncharacterized protein n=1 Tax=Tuwongella immobilis TaxID=692036 RepID=A0A6C2YLR4_9BACT|nr:hypothetical protein [Tuwongella immobilis]VIP02035.1 Putative uncharacterized protein OS=uncultured planctomycete GN=HGMM_F33C03C22 PE=4 SV=1 [Tuwongella immobilis]VTS00192.1 Putative uncharacterized protein OS=uncultured planctomycete GN=HGMM_F33C03C22 PE=4 SV=1 [Tuwongella immobilis]